MAGAGHAHPLFERVEVLSDEPPYDRALMERLEVSGLHVGCGPNIRRRWLNTDRRMFGDAGGGLSPAGRIVRASSEQYRERYFLSQDALEPYPIEDGAFDYAYSEHFIEHVPREGAVAWLREVHRLIRPGGFVRLSTPDLRKYVEGYLEPDGVFFARRRELLENMPHFGPGGVPERPGFMVNQIFRYFGHQWIYDLEEIRSAAAEAGFDQAAVTECSFHEGRLEVVAAMDQPGHRDESLYVEIERT
jgi:predicted SAM-dependent methyltransferase